MTATLLFHLEKAWEEAKEGLSAEALGSRWGVILASTKGNTEDVVWQNEEKLASTDPLTPILEAMTPRLGVKVTRKICVSNACASSHGALFLAEHWLRLGVVDQVAVLAADGVGRFVEAGFKSLGALSKTKTKPFAPDRDGLQLGEAAAVLLLSLTIPSDLRVTNTSLETEGASVTRPSPSGESLLSACRHALGTASAEVIIAHATATVANDLVEDHVFCELFPVQAPIVTGTKWSIGHTLGASGAIDVIAAAEILRRQTAFCLGNTDKADPKLKSNYALRGRSLSGSYRRALVTSLGFGSVYAALIVERETLQ
jgi:3-oxoacyl-[acyl-carrier-protein] synthase I